VANRFDPDFYITCATVIPVLFLAVAVGSSYKTLLRTAVAAARARRGVQGWKRQLRPYLVSRILLLTAYAIWVAGAVGEFFALQVLYQGHEQTGDRTIVFAGTIVLVAAASAGPLGAYLDVRGELRKLGSPSQLAISEIVEDQLREALPQADERPG
jgi:hypothetical protein